MDAKILFPEIGLFGSVSNKLCSLGKQPKDPPVRKISKARRRKIRLMKMKNSMADMEVASIHHSKSVQPVCDETNLLFGLINNGDAAHESSSLDGDRDVRKPVLPVDSFMLLSSIDRDSASPVVTLDGTPVVGCLTATELLATL